jgi:hypothetical protein
MMAVTINNLRLPNRSARRRIAPVIADLPVVELGYLFIQHPRELRLLLG